MHYRARTRDFRTGEKNFAQLSDNSSWMDSGRASWEFLYCEKVYVKYTGIFVKNCPVLAGEKFLETPRCK